MQLNDIITLRIEKFVQGGLTLAHHDGKVIFVEKALAGELVTAKIRKQTKTHSFATTIKVIEPGPNRIASDCAIFDRCGGCSFRHIPYHDEIRLKQNLLQEHRHLRPKLGDFQMITADADHYRHHTKLQLQAEPKAVGFFETWSNQIVPLPADGCKQLTEPLNEKISTITTDRQINTAKPSVSLYLNDDQTVIGSDQPANVTFSFAGFNWVYRPQMFFQANRFLIQPWLDYIDSLVTALPNRIAVELFCGTALIGGYVRRHLKKYTGIESDRQSIELAKQNFDRHKLSAKFQIKDLYQPKEQFGLSNYKTDLWIINPPRAGMKEPLCIEIGKSKATEIIYSSCNPQTLDRDVAILERSGFRLTRLRGFDFFPRTPHLEIIALLQR